jgi:hypothetical protein
VHVVGVEWSYCLPQRIGFEIPHRFESFVSLKPQFCCQCGAMALADVLRCSCVCRPAPPPLEWLPHLVFCVDPAWPGAACKVVCHKRCGEHVPKNCGMSRGLALTLAAMANLDPGVTGLEAAVKRAHSGDEVPSLTPLTIPSHPRKRFVGVTPDHLA